jgi:hypothetical protein
VRRAYAVLALPLLLAACGQGGRKPTFNTLPSQAATAPAKPPYVPKTGHSAVTMRGALTIDTTQDFQCSYAVDDFFVRGEMGQYDGVPLYLSINVEFYKGPGTYAKKTQVLLRRVSADTTTYASWYAGDATATILARGSGADLVEVSLPPEAGTQATDPVTIAGHFGCLGNPSPGPG